MRSIGTSVPNHTVVIRSDYDPDQDRDEFGKWSGSGFAAGHGAGDTFDPATEKSLGKRPSSITVTHTGKPPPRHKPGVAQKAHGAKLAKEAGEGKTTLKDRDAEFAKAMLSLGAKRGAESRDFGKDVAEDMEILKAKALISLGTPGGGMELGESMAEDEAYRAMERDLHPDEPEEEMQSSAKPDGDDEELGTKFSPGSFGRESNARAAANLKADLEEDRDPDADDDELGTKFAPGSFKPGPRDGNYDPDKKKERYRIMHGRKDSIEIGAAPEHTVVIDSNDVCGCATTRADLFGEEEKAPSESMAEGISDEELEGICKGEITELNGSPVSEAQRKAACAALESKPEPEKKEAPPFAAKE